MKFTLELIVMKRNKVFGLDQYFSTHFVIRNQRHTMKALTIVIQILKNSVGHKEILLAITPNGELMKMMRLFKLHLLSLFLLEDLTIG